MYVKLKTQKIIHESNNDVLHLKLFRITIREGRRERAKRIKDIDKEEEQHGLISITSDISQGKTTLNL